MSAVALLLGLLVLSYVGSILVGGRTIRGFGLPSGAEYLLFGFVLGPHVLGVLNRSLVQAFEPVLIGAAAWIALVAGVGYGQVGERRVHVGRALSGILLAMLVAAGVGAAVYTALLLLGAFTAAERFLLALGSAAVSSETTRHAVRWVVERHGAKGRLSDSLADYARASVMVPALAVAVLFAAAPGHQGLPQLGLEGRVAITFAVGVVLGLVATLLLGREFRRDESWGIFLGTSLLGTGVAARLGLSALATTFAMGLTVTLVSPHRSDLKAMVAPSEKPVMLPVAVLAGASVDPLASEVVPVLVAVALGARLVMELVRGAMVSAALRDDRAPGSLVGLGMVSTGAFTIACAVSTNLRVPGQVGASLLALAAASVLFGELAGPVLLRRALVRARNIIPGQSQTPPPPSVRPTRPEFEDSR